MDDTSTSTITTPDTAGFDRDAVRRRLEDVRERTLTLVAPLEWPTLRKQHVPILSPMVWDLGHIGNFEEMWLLRNAFGDDWLHAGYERMFDAVENPRPTREALPLPERGELFDYLAAVRERAFTRLLGNGGGADPRLTAGGFVYELVAEHEEQHQETLLQALQAMGPPFYRPALRRPQPPAPPHDDGMVEIPAGPFTMGWGRPGFAYDNEKGAHTVDLPAFRIDRTPVTNGAWLEFIADGGYGERGCWSDAGWAWKEETAATAPLYWLAPGEPAPEGVDTEIGAQGGDDGWRLRRLGRVLPVDPAEPVIHVSFHEAEAYARWAGKRLPSEAEWEKAALWGPDLEPGRDRPRLHPWGDAPADGRRANLDQLAFGPAPAGAYPDGASAWGVLGMVGDVWEWTASDFRAYPDFEAFPYPEYSQIFFGDEYKVLRGGSWATRAAVARGTFRNWDFPIRRQIFSGLRCAADV